MHLIYFTKFTLWYSKVLLLVKIILRIAKKIVLDINTW